MQNQIIKKLIDEARNNTEFYGSGRVAAALYDKKRFICSATASKKTHTLQKKFSKHPEAIYLHAEINAIRKALLQYNSEYLQHMTLYIARLKYTSDKEECHGLAAPCKGCLQAIEAFNIKRVVYTTDTVNVLEELVR